MIYPFLPEAEIEARASSFRREALGADSDSYPLDLDAIVYDHLCERCDLVFDDQHELGTEDGDPILGKMLPFQNKILITLSLSREFGRGRYRFTVAHEMGHWVLHRVLFLATVEQNSLFGSSDSREGLASLNRNLFPKSASRRVPPEEWQANRFASALLVGRAALESAFRHRFGDPPLPRCEGQIVRCTSLRSLSRSLASQRVRGQLPLYEVFGLSVEAMAIALEARGLVIESAQDVLC